MGCHLVLWWDILSCKDLMLSRGIFSHSHHSLKAMTLVCWKNIAFWPYINSESCVPWGVGIEKVRCKPQKRREELAPPSFVRLMKSICLLSKSVLFVAKTRGKPILPSPVCQSELVSWHITRPAWLYHGISLVKSCNLGGFFRQPHHPQEDFVRT